MKKALMIAYAFPPMAYAGVHRTLRFCKYLPRYGWSPLVLTIKDYSYHKREYSLMGGLSETIKMYRTSTIDPVKWHMLRSQKANLKSPKPITSRKECNKEHAKQAVLEQFDFLKRIKRLLSSFVSFPDHNVFWIPFAVIEGIKIMLKQKPHIIYVSSPPHSSQFIGLILSKLFKKPWIADFRDPWIGNVYFEQSLKTDKHMRIVSQLESLVMKNATTVLLNTDANKDAVLRRYAYLNQRKFETLTNGFDRDDVRGITPKYNSKFTITFIGTFYSYFKTDLFLAGLKLWLKHIGHKDFSNRFQVLFVGGKNYEVETMIREKKLSTIVRFVDFLPKKKAMEICMGSHLLLLLLGFNKSSERILPSKLFDYLLCKRPILAIVPNGEAATLIKRAKAGYVVSDENPSLVAQVINNEYKAFIEKEEFLYSPNWSEIEKYDSIKLTAKLAIIFNQITKGNSIEDFRDN